MFKKIERTNFPPSQHTMVWDGECGFCRYWITHWQRHTGGLIVYRTYQEVSSNFPDIPLKEFKKASRLIESDGRVFSGPDSAFRSYTHSNKGRYWHTWYQKYTWFQKACDHTYNFIAKHRSFFYSLTILLFGKNPKKLQPYWAFYTIAIVGMVILLSYIL